MTMSIKRQRQHDRLLGKMKLYQLLVMQQRRAQASADKPESGKESTPYERPTP